MPTLIALFFLSLGISILLTPVVRRLAIRCGLMDRPDQRRKLHAQVVPVAGGIAVLLASLAALSITLFVGDCPWQGEFFNQAGQWLGLAAASILIAGVGVVDDWGRLRGRHKIFGQIAAISIVMGTGLVVHHVRIASVEFDLGLMAIPFT